MPELPDVEIFKREAEKALKSRITDFDIPDNHFVDAGRHELKTRIVNHKLKEVSRKGKYLFLSADNRTTIVMHFGMTGTLKYASEKEDPPKYVKCIFKLEDGHHLDYSSKRKLGSLEITDDINKYLQDLDLGPDALEISEGEFRDKLAGSHAMIKRFLMDQTQTSGIGNIYADEILFQTGIHPKKKSASISESRQAKLYREMVRVLETAIEKGADVNQFPEGFLLPRRETGADCPRCKGKVKKIKVSGRAGYYCPSCQAKK